MSVDLFRLLCEELGYEPKDVLSVRVNPRRAFVSFVNSSGELCRANHVRRAEGFVPVAMNAPADPARSGAAPSRDEGTERRPGRGV